MTGSGFHRGSRIDVPRNVGIALYIATFRRLACTDDDLCAGGSNRFVDGVVFWGDPEAVTRKLHGQVTAGADHVAVQVIGVEPGASALPPWRLPAEALLPTPPRAPTDVSGRSGPAVRA